VIYFVGPPILDIILIIIIIIIIIVRTMFIYGETIARVHSGHLNECGPIPGGCQLIGQAALT